jgi:hypothetical protein
MSSEVETMTQESALTREEIEALDDEIGTLGFEPAPERDDPDARLDALAIRTQQPEDRS